MASEEEKPPERGVFRRNLDKGELLKLRNYNQKDVENSTAFRGKPSTANERIALYIHELWQLRDMRFISKTSSNTKRFKVPSFTRDDRDEFDDCINRASNFLERERKKIHAMKDSAEKRKRLEEFMISDDWLTKFLFEFGDDIV